MFISPEGESLFVQTSHINAVINDPGLFGITHKEIQKTYQNHDEPLGLEGIGSKPFAGAKKLFDTFR